MQQKIIITVDMVEHQGEQAAKVTVSMEPPIQKPEGGGFNELAREQQVAALLKWHIDQIAGNLALTGFQVPGADETSLSN